MFNKERFYLETNGRGYWSRKVTEVDIEELRLQYCNPEQDFGELCVHFAQSDWDVSKDGLIYTDKKFMQGLRAYLQTIGFTKAEANDVSYSEQGMQTEEYVSCDVGAKFLKGLERVDEAHLFTIWKECIDV
jgi:hypothetical protein